MQALDLQKEEETKPVLELLELITKGGGKLKVLSITIEELKGIVDRAISNYSNSLPTTTINEACLRLNKNKAWLISQNAKLKDILETKFGCKIIPMNKQKYLKSSDIKSLADERLRRGTAIHDVLAYLYIRDKRTQNTTTFQKAEVWFVSHNKDLLNFNIERMPNGSIPEIILPDALTSLLWLKNPNQLFNKIKSIGLSELMALTLREENATRELIIEFDNNLKMIDDLSEDDYKILLESVAHQSAKSIERLNDTIIENKQKARSEALKIVEKERSRRKSSQISEKTKQEENSKLIEKLNILEKQLSDNHKESKTKIEELSSKVDSWPALINKYINRIIIGVVSLIILISVLIFFNQINLIFAKILSFATSLSALWSLGSFLINAYKLYKGK